MGFDDELAIRHSFLRQAVADLLALLIEKGVLDNEDVGGVDIWLDQA